MIFKLSNALSDVLIRLLDPDSENVEISKISKFSFVGQNSQNSKSTGKSYTEFVFEFLGPKTLLYVKYSKCRHVLVTLHNFVLKKSIFWKTHK